MGRVWGPPLEMLSATIQIAYKSGVANSLLLLGKYVPLAAIPLPVKY
jgi:hypothetical protein